MSHYSSKTIGGKGREGRGEGKGGGKGREGGREGRGALIRGRSQPRTQGLLFRAQAGERPWE